MAGGRSRGRAMRLDEGVQGPQVGPGDEPPSNGRSPSRPGSADIYIYIFIHMHICTCIYIDVDIAIDIGIGIGRDIQKCSYPEKLHVQVCTCTYVSVEAHALGNTCTNITKETPGTCAYAFICFYSCAGFLFKFIGVLLFVRVQHVQMCLCKASAKMCHQSVEMRIHA